MTTKLIPQYKQMNKSKQFKGMKQYWCASAKSIPEEAMSIQKISGIDSYQGIYYDGFTDFNRDTMMPFGYTFSLPNDIEYKVKKFQKIMMSKLLYKTYPSIKSYYELVNFYDDEEFDGPMYDEYDKLTYVPSYDSSYDKIEYISHENEIIFDIDDIEEELENESVTEEEEYYDD
jgi:hypothetical protein